MGECCIVGVTIFYTRDYLYKTYIKYYTKSVYKIYIKVHWFSIKGHGFMGKGHGFMGKSIGFMGKGLTVLTGDPSVSFISHGSMLYYII